MPFNIRGQSIASLNDFTNEQIMFLIKLSADLKSAKYDGVEQKRLLGKNIALIFEKPSTRTRCAFEVAAYDQGANVTYLGPNDTHMGYKESIKDTARVLGRYYDAIECRCFAQKTIDDLVKYSNVPVWNGLTDDSHPTQTLADLLTIQEHSPKPFSEIKLCFLGDGSNNVARSLMVGASKVGIDFRIACPDDARPSKDIISLCEKFASENNSKITITSDVERAVKDCDFLYTDVWVSMGDPEDMWQRRIKQMLPYQVNKKVMSLTDKPDTKFMHCLPAFHNRETEKGEAIFQKYGLDALEVTDDVFESANSIVFQQAENRMHTIKAIMVATLQ